MDPVLELSETIKEAMVSRIETQTKDSEVIKNAREVLHKEKMIHSFTPREDFGDMTYGMTDGASIKERTQGMDLTCIALAGMDDGYFHYNLEDEDKPFVSWSAVKNYKKSYESQTQTIMMLCEVAVMGKLKGYNYRGMDGAYSTSLLNLLISINNNECDLILDFIQGEHGQYVLDGIDELLSPPQDSGHHIIGIAKSDSGESFIDEFGFLLNDVVKTILPTDRTLASAILRPGEMFVPINKKLGSFLDKGITNRIEDMGLSDAHKDILHYLNNKFLHNELNDRVYSTYFCPSHNALPGKVMRVDFSLPLPKTALADKEILPIAEEAVQVVNNDVVSERISEPYAQFKVDEFCKKTIKNSFKQAKREAREIFDEQDPSGLLGNNILESYRT